MSLSQIQMGQMDWLTCPVVLHWLLVFVTVFSFLQVQLVYANELINTNEHSGLDSFASSKEIFLGTSGPQAILQLQREKRELAYRLDKQRSNLQLIKMERSFDIQKKHEKEAEESYLRDLETELDKRIAQLQPIVEKLLQTRQSLEEKVEVIWTFIMKGYHAYNSLLDVVQRSAVSSAKQ